MLALLIRLGVPPWFLRVTALIAASVVGLACGTNYIFSAWGSQFGMDLKLSSMEVNHIGLAGNLGHYLAAALAGFLVDKRGPRIAAILGAFAIYHGYMTLAYESERKRGTMRSHCLLTFLTGVGNALGSQACIKTAALNFRRNRGAAMAMPLSAYGLSAFFFSRIGLIAFGSNNDGFLRLLAYAGGLMTLIAGLLLITVPPSDELCREGEPSELPSSDAEKRGDTEIEIGGRELFRKVEFWQLASLLCLLTGIGLMTINNLGLDIKWLWNHQKFSATDGHIQKQQLQQVSFLSMASFAGRLVSGFISDYLVNNLQRSRVWCLFIAAAGFAVAQIFAIVIDSPHQVGYLSVAQGLSYGFAFGSFPPVVAQFFGVKHFSQNWGILGLFAILSGYYFNSLYGTISDSNSEMTNSGKLVCLKGVKCYNQAYYFTFTASIAALFLARWIIARQEKLAQITPKKGGDRLA